MNAFEKRVSKDCSLNLVAEEIRIIQVNIGYRCNQSCRHCHLECGPDREETMDWDTMIQIVGAAEEIRPEMVDITGGAPEIHPHFRPFVEALRETGLPVKVRTNLTAMEEPGMESLPRFLRDHQVQLVASLPCYLEENVSAQRGEGVYLKSVAMLKELNTLGYGRSPDLSLNLVYNPGGPFLPPNQADLEMDYKKELSERFSIQFTGLYTITNMPIGRFWESLKQEKRDREYMELLSSGFNCQTVDGLMCRHQVCVAWDGTLYDCDFNIALGLPLEGTIPDDIEGLDLELHGTRKIRTGNHCFGCTAGFGSSCTGALNTNDN